MMLVFADTSALYAVLDADDDCHAAAAKAWRSLIEDDVMLVTSNYVLLETNALVQRRLGVTAVGVLNDAICSVLDIHWITPAEHASALAAFRVANRKKLSLVDCTSFEVMRQIRARDVFAFDAHFKEQGFQLFGAAHK
jgi:predicted nucleic acid-binding protein